MLAPDTLLLCARVHLQGSKRQQLAAARLEEKAKKPDWYISVVVCAFFGIGFLASALFSGKLKSEAGQGVQLIAPRS